MARNNRFNQHRQQRRLAPPTSMLRQAPSPAEFAAPVQYGNPVIVMEDESKNTFIYDTGAWVPHDRSIAECRQDCLVKELPQKLNRMTRYEVRSPV